jgi:two-component system, OmpR family, phosphate regulon sensor histidine kinase PhoR
LLNYEAAAIIWDMWPSQLFWKLFLTSACLVALSISAILFIVVPWQEDQLLEQAWHRLNDAALLLRDDLSDDLARPEPERLQEKIRRIGKQTDIRYTVLDANGNVLADSDLELTSATNKMENHLSRKEFIRAKRDGIGKARRTSPTLGEPFLYVAMTTEEVGGVNGFVRAALPVIPIRDQAALIEKRLAWICMGVIAICLVFAYWLIKRQVRPIDILTDAAEGIAAGKYARRIRVNTGDEFGILAQCLEQMSTELGSRETQLRESVQRQTTVLGGMVEGVIAVDSGQHVLFANVAAGTKLGFRPERVEGLPLLEVVRSHELRELVQQSLETSQTVRGEIAWQSRKRMLTLDVQATPLAGSPAPGVVLVLHDVTELKRLEGLRQQFVANVSHELKTPLSSIKAYTETLLNGALEDPKHARHFLTRIDDQATRLHELILDLLSLARIESGQAALEIISLPLSKMVEKCLGDHEERAKSSGLRIENLVSDSPLIVRADEEGLLQILGNLIDNAIKYTPAGGAITIRCREEANQAVIEVADTGVGIEREHHGRLFERFYRVDKARSRELGGTGLGLAIVKHLCQAMDGTVSVQSELGRGSVFGVRLPLGR